MFLLYLKYIMIVILASHLWEHVEGHRTNLDNYLQIPEDLIESLYEKYKEAFEDDSKDESLRRLFTKNKAYEIHVKRLKDVNGYKTHNLLIKGVNTLDNQLIYINNPVETKLPNAFISLNEFRNILTHRIQKQKEELAKLNKNKKNRFIIKIARNHKHKPTRTNSKLRNYRTMTTDTMETEDFSTQSTLFYMIQMIRNKKNLRQNISKDNSTEILTKKNIKVNMLVKSKKKKNKPVVFKSISNPDNDSQETTRKKIKKLRIRITKNPSFDSIQSIEDHTLGTTNSGEYLVNPTAVENETKEVDRPAKSEPVSEYEPAATGNGITSSTSTTSNIPDNLTENLSPDTSMTPNNQLKAIESKTIPATKNITLNDENLLSPTEGSTLDATEFLSTDDLSTNNAITTQPASTTNEPGGITETISEVTENVNNEGDDDIEHTTNDEVENTLEPPVVKDEENEELTTVFEEETPTPEETSTIPTVVTRELAAFEDDGFNAFLPIRTRSRIVIRTTTTTTPSTTTSRRRTLGRPAVYMRNL